MSTKRDARTIVVAGDNVIDWNTALISGDGTRPDMATTNPAPGGAWLLASMIRSMLSAGPEAGGIQVISEPVPSSFRVVDATNMHSHLFMENPCGGPEGRCPKAWRVNRKLGYRIALRKPKKSSGFPASKGNLLVLDDAALGFRDDPARCPGWGGNPPPFDWIIYKMSSSIASGRLWEMLESKLSRTIAIVRIEELRHLGALISSGISWEKTCDELSWAMRFDPRLTALARCACTVVLFPWAGAFIYDRLDSAGDRDARCRLVFDPRKLEGQWEEGCHGTMIGVTQTLTAAIAREFVVSPTRSAIENGIVSGLKAMRQAFRAGFEIVGGDGNGSTVGKGAGKKGTPGGREDPPIMAPRLTFPIRSLTKTPDVSDVFYAVDVPRPWGQDFKEGWTLLETGFRQKVEDVAKNVVKHGVGRALASVPVATFGALQTADRSEIESYNAIRNLIEEYLASDLQKPLSIAVFGPPGAGKSFGIKQIAEGLSRGRIKDKEFNLSQFGGPEDLFPAFHEVRDIVLGGRLPLIFWDEFDTSRGADKLFWLKYFLMPMQDGRFREGALEHPLGKCIFVFAGGTSPTFKDFCETCGRGSGTEFREAKGPDFVSRLKGHIDVLGPNQRIGDNGLPDPDDRFVMLRRAILLRSIIEKNARQLIREKDGVREVGIDDSVLDAFLGVSYFKHGVRSMESLVTMSRLGHCTHYERSSLPQSGQIAGHVDAAEFLEIVQRPSLTVDVIEMMARAVHAIYVKNADGPTAGKSFDDLKPEYKESNRKHACFLNERLMEGGFMAVPLRGAVTRMDISRSELERLAMQEHGRWVEERRALKCRLGYPKKELPEGVSPYMVDWHELPERIKEIDRRFITELPETLRGMGFMIRRNPTRQRAPSTDEGQVTRVGVIGHGVCFADGNARDQVENAFARIRAANGGARIELVCSLAGDAERQVARIALQIPGTTLRVPLPAEPGEYQFYAGMPEESQIDFEDLLFLARQHFVLPPAADPAAALEQAGEFVVDDSDVLLILRPSCEGRVDDETERHVARARELKHRLFMIPPSR